MSCLVGTSYADLRPDTSKHRSPERRVSLLSAKVLISEIIRSISCAEARFSATTASLTYCMVIGDMSFTSPISPTGWITSTPTLLS